MRILILGSEGFIGSHCVSYFLTNNHTVYGIDIFEQPSQHYTYFKVSRLSPELEDFFTKHKIDAVINAAGSGNVTYSMSHPMLDFEANSLDTIRILDVIRKSQPLCKYLHLSSAAVYGNPSSLPVSENNLPNPLSPYGWHKLIAEQLCREYNSVYGLRTAIARPFSVYGPGLKKQLFWDVYQKIKSGSDGIILFGTGKESRDYIFVTDLVYALNLILENGFLGGEIYNVGTGIETAIEESVSLFLKTLDRNTTLQFDGVMRGGDPLNWRADVSKIKELGFTPKVSLEHGLSRVATWICKF